MRRSRQNIYRRGVGSPLAKRDERLVEEAERAGFMGRLPAVRSGLKRAKYRATR
jgi:hypothetical protein